MRVISRDWGYWSIVTVMRGDDTPVPYLKHIFTCRFRYLVGIRKEDYHVTVREHETVEEYKLHSLFKSLLKKDVWYLREHIYHYLGHVYDCLLALRTLNMIDRLEHDFLCTICDLIVSVLYEGKKPEDAIKELKEKYPHMITDEYPHKLS